MNPKQTGKTLDIRLRTEGYNVPLIWAMKKKGPLVVVWGIFGDEILRSYVGIISYNDEIRIPIEQPVLHGK